MTNTTEQQARELAEELAKLFGVIEGITEWGWECSEQQITAALTAARNQALEEAANLILEHYVPNGPRKPITRRKADAPETARLFAAAIRAMKTEVGK